MGSDLCMYFGSSCESPKELHKNNHIWCCSRTTQLTHMLLYHHFFWTRVVPTVCSKWGLLKGGLVWRKAQHQGIPQSSVAINQLKKPEEEKMLMGVFLFASTVPWSVGTVRAHGACFTQLQPPACYLRSFSFPIELTVFAPQLVQLYMTTTTHCFKQGDGGPLKDIFLF